MLKKIKIPKQILILLTLALILNIFRIIVFKTNSSLYMFWNIFLAYIPLFISSVLIIYTKKENIFKPLFVVGFIFWFIFFPNAPYVMTDLIHLGKSHIVPIMFDVFFFFSSAYVSLLMGLYSLSHMEKIFLLRFSKKVVNIIIPVIILFTSFGIYLGRFLRFNSWDFFTSHISLVSSIWDIFTKNNSYINVYYYIGLFFVFIYIAYLSFKSTQPKHNIN